jgi:hypothetical protein
MIVICALLGVLIAGWVSWRGVSSRRQVGEARRVTINKQAVNFVKRTFDPANPPGDMPSLRPGEGAACDSDFQSNATVGGQTRQTDATHAILTVTHVNVTLLLNVTIWVPAEVSEQMIEHEEGHREISEYYYQTADKIAESIAARYIGKQIDVAGADTVAESNKLLQQMASDITAEYNRELSPGPAQLLYDDITDHSRNGVVVKDAVDHALKNVTAERPQAGRD